MNDWKVMELMRRVLAGVASVTAGLLAAVWAVAPAQAAASDGLSVDLAGYDGSWNDLGAGDMVTAGDMITFTVFVHNAAGADTATDVKAELWLPDGVTFDPGMNDSDAVYDSHARTVTWDGTMLLSTIVAGDTPKLDVFVTADDDVDFGDLTTYAQAGSNGTKFGDPADSCEQPLCVALNESGSGGDDPTTDPTAEPTTEPSDDPTAEPTTEPSDDPTAEPTTEPSDDPTAEPSDDPTAEPTTEPGDTQPDTDLAVTVSADKTSAVPGDVIEYTVTVTNTGTGTQDDSRLSVMLSPGLTFGSSNPDGVTDADSGTVDILLGDLDTGTAAQVTVSASVNADATPGSALGVLVSVNDGDWWKPSVCTDTFTACATDTVTVAEASSTDPGDGGTTVDTGRPGTGSPAMAGAGLLMMAAAGGLVIAVAPRPRRAR